MTDNKYNKTWLEKRAISSLKKIKDGVWDFSDSLLLYTPSGSDTYEELQKTDSPYYKLVTQPEREYLATIAKDVVALLPDHVDYIDLGPGTEHKEQFFFDELRKQGKTFTYLPVDISDQFLAMADDYASKQGIAVHTMKGAFEELPDLLKDWTNPRFVSLGLTFSNYDPAFIIRLLQEIAGANGWSFINAQVRNRVDMTQLQRVYQADAVQIANEKLQLLGLDPEGDVTPREADDGFRVWCTVTNTNDHLRKVGVNNGDKLLVFQSLRYTKDQLEKVLAGTKRFEMFDTGKSFVATMIQS